MYFFYPETAYRSLEEIDTIFAKTKGWLGVVRTAREEPRRYGRNGEVLVDYEETEAHLRRVGSGAGKEGARQRRVEGASGEGEGSEKSSV